MFGAGCTAQITLEPSPKGFYMAGDVISGVIDLHTTGVFSITDVQVKLRCDEYSVATYYPESGRQMRRNDPGGFIRPLRLAAQQQAVKHLGKAGNLDEDTIDILSNGLRVVRERKKHYQLTANAFSSAPDEEKTTLSEGHHSYPFSMRVSEAINKCPPHAPIWTVHGLKVGVYWTVKVVVRRPGRFQANVREVIPVHVYPESPYKAHLNLAERKEVRAEGRRSGGRLSARFTYPAAGMSQNGQPFPFTLDVVAKDRFDIHSIKMVLAQTCIAKAQGLKETYSDSLELAVARGPRVDNESVDLLPYIDPVRLEELIEPTVALKNVNITYELVVIIAVPHYPITLRIPITVLSPADTAPPPFSPQEQQASPLPPQYTQAARDGPSVPSYSHQGPSYVLPEKSPYPTGGRSAGNGGSSKHSTAASDIHKPALPSRSSADAPPHPPRPSHVNATNRGSNRPTDATGPVATTYSGNIPSSASAASAQEQAGGSNPWYPGMQQTSSSSLSPGQEGSHEATNLLHQRGPQISVPATTNATFVESMSSPEAHLSSARGEQAPVELPSYDDAVGPPNA